MNQPIRVRPASPADLPAVLALFWASSRPMYARLGATEPELDRWEQSGHWEPYWSRRVAEGRVLVAEESETLLGMLGLVSVDPHTGGLVSIYTATPGRGVGSALVAAALEQAAERGYRELELATGVTNDAMRALAVKYGFTPGRRFRRPEFTGVDFLLYRRPLN